MHSARLYSPAAGTGTAFTSNPAAAQLLDQRLIIALLVAAVTYQALLCLANTQVVSVSRALVGLAEAAILMACLPFLARRLLPGVIVLATAAAAILCLLTLLNGDLNVKAFRDLIIPLCFFWLGCNVGRPELADRALMLVIGIVLAMGLLEFFFLDLYTNFFNIFGYYVNIGNLQVITEYTRDSRLQMNGMRPEGIGRTLLPGLLGSHRVSSVFLEPVSLGNFAALTAAWGLSRDKVDWRKGLIFFGAAMVMMVLSDSRFALMSVSIMILMRVMLCGNAINLAVLAPFAAVALLLFMGLTTTENVGDNFMGRLAVSGWSLLEFDAITLLGAGHTHGFADEGYAFVLSTFGLPLCLMLWASLWFLRMPDERGQRFRAFISIYIALILCVSGTSLFAFKTAGMLWFLMGCALKLPAPDKSSVPSLHDRTAALNEKSMHAFRGINAG